MSAGIAPSELQPSDVSMLRRSLANLFRVIERLFYQLANQQA